VAIYHLWEAVLALQGTSSGNQIKWTRSGRGFRVDAEASADEVRLELHGEVDLYTQPILRSAMQTALEMNLPSIVVDLADVTHLDSGGMAILIYGAKKLMERQGKLHLRSVNRHIFRTLTVTGLAEFLNATPAEVA